MKILLIEDSRFLRIVLAKAGYPVTGVSDGREGLHAARTSTPALILLDMMLPGLDGTGVLKALKQDASTAQIPVIVLTALSQKNEAKLKNAGAAGLMAALIKADDLRACVGSEPIVSSRVSTNITISMGVAVSTDHPNGDITSLLNQADRGLYAAKQNGRNRVEHVDDCRTMGQTPDITKHRRHSKDAEALDISTLRGNNKI